MDDAFECIRECTHVEEAAELAILIKEVVDSKGAAARAIAPRFIQIVRYKPIETMYPFSHWPVCSSLTTRHWYPHWYPSPQGPVQIACTCWLQLQKYQEQSHLLDPLLEDLVTPLAAQLRRLAGEGQDASLGSVQSVSCLLWALVTVRCTPRSLLATGSF